MAAVWLCCLCCGSEMCYYHTCSRVWLQIGCSYHCTENVFLTHANCTQLKSSSGHGSWPRCWVVIGINRGLKEGWVLGGVTECIFLPCDKCSSWRVGRPHWPHFLLGRKQWKYGRILLPLLQCTIGGSRSLLRSKMLKFCTNSAIVDNVGGNAKFWWLSQSYYVIRGMARGKGEFWEMRREFKTGLETSESTFELPRIITIADKMQWLSGQAGLDLSKKKDFICNSSMKVSNVAAAIADLIKHCFL